MVPSLLVPSSEPLRRPPSFLPLEESCRDQHVKFYVLTSSKDNDATGVIHSSTTKCRRLHALQVYGRSSAPVFFSVSSDASRHPSSLLALPQYSFAVQYHSSCLVAPPRLERCASGRICLYIVTFLSSRSPITRLRDYHALVAWKPAFCGATIKAPKIPRRNQVAPVLTGWQIAVARERYKKRTRLP
jgi:hypothetical protein